MPGSGFNKFLKNPSSYPSLPLSPLPRPLIPIFLILSYISQTHVFSEVLGERNNQNAFSAGDWCSTMSPIASFTAPQRRNVGEKIRPVAANGTASPSGTVGVFLGDVVITDLLAKLALAESNKVAALLKMVEARMKENGDENGDPRKGPCPPPPTSDVSESVVSASVVQAFPGESITFIIEMFSLHDDPQKALALYRIAFAEAIRKSGGIMVALTGDNNQCTVRAYYPYNISENDLENEINQIKNRLQKIIDGVGPPSTTSSSVALELLRRLTLKFDVNTHDMIIFMCEYTQTRTEYWSYCYETNTIMKALYGSPHHPVNIMFAASSSHVGKVCTTTDVKSAGKPHTNKHYTAQQHRFANAAAATASLIKAGSKVDVLKEELAAALAARVTGGANTIPPGATLVAAPDAATNPAALSPLGGGGGWGEGAVVSISRHLMGVMILPLLLRLLLRLLL